MLFRIFFCFSLSVAVATEVELFCDWAFDATGQSLFQIQDQRKEPSLPAFLSLKLKEKGHEIRSWEMDRYRPYLLSLKGIKSFTDFKHWLGIGLSKNEILLNDAKYWMFWNLGPKIKGLDFSKIPKEKLILVMWEPPTVQEELYDAEIQAHFGKIFTFDDDLVDNKKFFKFHYPALKPRVEKLIPFEEKKFCVMVARRLTSRHPKEIYSKRKEMIKFFEKKPNADFDLYGYYWKKKKRKNYRGELLTDKLEKLKTYKFSICYENTRNIRGYITEKIFDCLGAGTVPVYLGASNITDYIPKSCFIDRREFESNEELYQFLKAMSKSEYQKYLDAAEKFLKSDQAKVFTVEYFMENYLTKLGMDL